MAGDAEPVRVLVVDDMTEIRHIIERALWSDGWRVDSAVSAAEVRALDLSKYRVLLIDEHLGADRGSDLIAELAADDPEFARKCVVITGGSAGQLPDGVAVLEKPFARPALVELIRSMIGQQDRPANPPASQPAKTGPAPSAGQAGGSVLLIELIQHVQEYDKQVVSDRIHDGPAQDLGAAILMLDLVSQSVPTELRGRLDEIAALLAAAVATLRSVVGGPWTAPVTRQADPCELVSQVVHGLELPVSAVMTGQRLPLDPAEHRAVHTVLELLLDTVVPPIQRSRAEVEISDDLIAIDLTIHRGDDLPEDLQATQPVALDRLARALGGSALAGPGPGEQRAHVALARRAASAAP